CPLVRATAARSREVTDADNERCIEEAVAGRGDLKVKADTAQRVGVLAMDGFEGGGIAFVGWWFGGRCVIAAGEEGERGGSCHGGDACARAGFRQPARHEAAEGRTADAEAVLPAVPLRRFFPRCHAEAGEDFADVPLGAIERDAQVLRNLAVRPA